MNKNCVGITGLLLALILASSVLGFAKDSRTVALSHDAVVHGTTLPAGQYTIQWKDHTSGATVEFTRGKKVVLTTEGKLEDRRHKFDRNAVVYATGSDGINTISEIRLAGSSDVLVLHQ